MTVLLIIATLALGATPAADVAAVRGAEDGWSEAFVTGDGAYLERLLAPEYVSVGPTGEAHDKARIVDGARRFAAAHPNQHAKPMGPTSTIAVTGDMALVRHAGAGDVSVDVFQKRQDRWTAVFSQHTPVAAPKV